MSRVLCPFSVLFKDDFLRGRGGGGGVGFETYKKNGFRRDGAKSFSELKYFIKILKWHNVLILKAL